MADGERPGGRQIDAVYALRPGVDFACVERCRFDRRDHELGGSRNEYAARFQKPVACITKRSKATRLKAERVVNVAHDDVDRLARRDLLRRAVNELDAPGEFRRGGEELAQLEGIARFDGIDAPGAGATGEH